MDHLRIMEAAIHFIEQYLKEPIGLADVALKAEYSYYHMTRTFRAAIQEPIGNYIARRRLYEASRELIYTNKRIIDIATPDPKVFAMIAMRPCMASMSSEH